MTSILIHRPQQAARDGLLDTLTASDSIDRVVSAHTVDELLDGIRQDSPDVVLVGLEIDDLIEILGRVRAAEPTASVLVVGGRDRALRTAQAIAAGARGFLRRDAVAHLSPTAPGSPIGRSRTGAAGTRPPLTAREIQVLTGMSEGRSNSEIGREFFLSEDTIKTHARRMFRKLGAKDRAEAVAIGFRTGLLL